MGAPARAGRRCAPTASDRRLACPAQLGGIANLTCACSDGPEGSVDVLGWDCGPGPILDHWRESVSARASNAFLMPIGRWARPGRVL